eukprot:Opistho-2@21894
MSGKCVLGPLLCGRSSSREGASSGLQMEASSVPLAVVPTVVDGGPQRVRSHVNALRYAMQQNCEGDILSSLEALRRATENDTPGDIENRKVAGSSGVLQAVCTLLRECFGRPRVLEAGLAALRFITKGDGTNIQHATASGAVALTIDAMRKHPGEGAVQRYACMAIRSLTFNHPDNQREVVERGAAALVVLAMRNHRCDPAIQAAACMAIQNMTWLVADNRLVVEQSGAIQHIISALTVFPDEADVQRWGCGALQNLACSDHCTAKFMEIGLPRIVLAAMGRFDDDAMLQNYALGVCRNISYTKDYRSFMAKSGAVDLAWRAMALHADDDEIQNSACAFFFNTVIELPENGRLVVESRDALSILCRVMRHHARNDALTKKFQGLLKLIGRDGSRIVPDHDVACMSLQELGLRAVADHLPDPPEIQVPRKLAAELSRASQCVNCGRHYFSSSFAAAVKVDRTWTIEVFCSRACAIEMYAPPPLPIVASPESAGPVRKGTSRSNGAGSSASHVAGSSPVHSLLDGGLPYHMQRASQAVTTPLPSSTPTLALRIQNGESGVHTAESGGDSGDSSSGETGVPSADARAADARRHNGINDRPASRIEIPDFLGSEGADGSGAGGVSAPSAGPSTTYAGDVLWDTIRNGLSESGLFSAENSGDEEEIGEPDNDDGFVHVDSDEIGDGFDAMIGMPTERSRRRSSLAGRFEVLASRFAVGRRSQTSPSAPQPESAYPQPDVAQWLPSLSSGASAPHTAGSVTHAHAHAHAYADTQRSHDSHVRQSSDRPLGKRAASATPKCMEKMRKARKLA